MRIPLTLITVGFCALFTGCTKESSATEKPAAEAKGDCANCPDAMMTAATEHDPATLTKGITLTEFTPISTILAAPADFEGKRVLVKGEAVDVCATRGCWVKLKSDTGNDQALRIKVEDGEIVFPMTAKGHEVIAEGIVEKLVTPVETVREVRRKQAESKGLTFDPASVTEPVITWQVKGLGARWEN